MSTVVANEKECTLVTPLVVFTEHQPPPPTSLDTPKASWSVSSWVTALGTTPFMLTISGYWDGHTKASIHSDAVGSSTVSTLWSENDWVAFVRPTHATVTS